MLITVLEYGMCGIALLLLATWRALPLLAVAALVDLGFRRRLAAKYHAALWTLVVVRLALPFSLPVDWSVQRQHDEVAFYLLGFPSASTEPRVVYETRESRMRDAEKKAAPRPASATPVLSAEPQPPQEWSAFEYVVAGVWLALIGVWALVAAGSILRGWIAHWRFARRLKGSSELADARLVEMVAEECRSLGIARHPRVKEVPGLAAPAVLGLFRSVICLPPGALGSLTDQELRWALRHELAHVLRRDAWTLSFASTMLSLQWFNPFAWLAAARLRSYVEAAADDLALANAAPDEARDYGRLLLAFAERASSKRVSPALGLVPFVSGRGLRRRIERLTQGRMPQRRWIGWTLATATLALAAIGLTDASERVVETRRILVPDLTATLPVADDKDATTVAFRSYDVSGTLERIAESQPEADAAGLLLKACGDMAPHGSARIENGRLVAEVGAEQHRRLIELIDAWNADGPRQIVVDIRLMQPSLEIASSIDWATSRIRHVDRDGTQPLLAAKIPEERLVDLLRKMQGDTRSNVIQAPKVTVFNGQSFALGDVVQRPFVTDVDALVDGSFQPTVEVYDEGLQIKVRPKTTGDGAVDLRFEARVSKIGEVAEPRLPYRTPTWVQAPDVSVSSIASDVRLAVGESVLISLPPLDVEEIDADLGPTILYCVLTPRIIDEK